MLFNLDEKIYVNGEYITYKKLGEILEEEPLNLYMKVKYFGKNGRDLVEGDKPIEDQLQEFMIKGETQNKK